MTRVAHLPKAWPPPVETHTQAPPSGAGVEMPVPVSSAQPAPRVSQTIDGHVQLGAPPSALQPQITRSVVPVYWHGFPQSQAPAIWQVIGKFGLPYGNEVIQLVPGPQRRNGVADITSRLIPMYNPNWKSTFPAITPGTQRSQGTMAQQGPSRYGVYKLRRAVTAAQVQAAGAALLPFMNNSENPLIAPSNG